ncbi:MAG TPA: PfkB family carbohydrate kinase [Nocardiopsis listeri]|uniref:PfkB family carbohydrate kinase n=1 Tax=Nocardiopsis listeri TaxID=53440 RepID=UPI001D6A4FB1|nr:PfkB family carbohydrate kinase [Nocardiopsis listeri]HJE61772.1 PfkB family carbohydrate kinase [Nocardiopsis listeri]
MPVRLHHVGPVIIDVVMEVDGVPAPGGGSFASSARTLPGGGFNVVSAATRAGMEVEYAGAHGSGPNGDLVRSALRDEGVKAVHPPRPTDTGFCVVLVDPSAERTFVTHLGAEMDLPLTDLRGLRPLAGDFVYTVGYSLLPGERAEDLVTWIGGLSPDVRLVLDPAPVVGMIPDAILDRVLPRVDVLSLSAAEAATLTGTSDRMPAVTALTERVGGVVVLRIGAEGCLVAAPGSAPVHVPGFDVEAVDTNGAGDAHVGVFVAALATGEEVVPAARRANAAAALAVTRKGPATAPTAEEVEAFLQDRGR